MEIIRKYILRDKPMTLRGALEGCVIADSERCKSFIYKRYYGYVMTIVLRYIRYEMESEEVTNESFVKMFKKLPHFEQHPDDHALEKTFRAWIARIAVNTAIDVLRIKKHMPFIDDQDGTEINNLSVSITSTLEHNDILKLLDALPPIQKNIFNLYEIEGYSHDEIAQLLHIPESTSRTYLTRAKQKLRMLYSKVTALEKSTPKSF